MQRWILFGWLLGIATGCDSTTPEELAPVAGPVQARGERLLGFGVTEGAVGFETAFGEAKAAGIQVVELPQQWDEVHTKSGAFDSPFLPVANEVYSTYDVAVVLSLNPIDTTARRVPEWLGDKPFDDPETIRQFGEFVDYALAKLSRVKIAGVALGNEVDVFLDDDDARWSAYTTLIRETAARIRSQHPNLKIGVKTTWSGAVDKHTERIVKLNAACDVAMITYYPLDESFRVREPSSIAEDLRRLEAAVGELPIQLCEVGYPSGADNGSSEAQQAAFVSAMFDAWDRSASRIQLTNFVWLHDMSGSEVDTLTKYYGSQDAAFRSYLATLGLKTNSGKPKPAFMRLKQEAKARGW